MKSVALHNLGCKVNAYEIEVMQQNLQESGFKIVPFDSEADIYIVNTCTVTNIADRKSRQMLHRAKHKNPDAVVVAVGCYVQTGAERVEEDGCIDLAVGNNRKKDIVDILNAFLKERESGRRAGTASDIIDISNAREYEEMTLSRTAEHTRAYIKVQDGCNQFCSYCIIPFARGRVRSRRKEDVLEEVRNLAAKGYREVVLTVIHVSSYGMGVLGETGEDYLNPGGDLRQQAMDRGFLISLIEAIAGIDGISRIRLGSLEPRIITESFAERLAAVKKVCPHFHLSLQSGCDETLKRMNRHYTAGEYYEKVEILRRFFKNPAITTDVIAGFPGETEEEFERTRAFLEKVRFFEMHVFKYSRRKGTVADRMDGQLTDAVKTARSAVLLALEAKQSREYRASYIGQEVEILIEERKEIGGKRWWVGHTPAYVRAAVPADEGRELSANGLCRGIVSGFLTDEIVSLNFSGK